MSADSGFAAYLDKWRQQEPEMEFAEALVPRPLRARFCAWGALLVELEASLWRPTDSQVAMRRLAWWTEQLHDHEPQHPLARALRNAGIEAVHAAPVAAAALAVARSDEAPADTAAALAQLSAFADTVGAAERQLFPGGGTDASPRSAVAIGMLGRRAAEAHALPLLRERLPLHLLARHPQSGTEAGAAHALATDFAAELLAHAAQCTGLPLPLYRAVRWQFDRERLQRLARGRVIAPGQPVPGPLRAPWIAWREVRRALG